MSAGEPRDWTQPVSVAEWCDRYCDVLRVKPAGVAALGTPLAGLAAAGLEIAHYAELRAAAPGPVRVYLYPRRAGLEAEGESFGQRMHREINARRHAARRRYEP